MAKRGYKTKNVERFLGNVNLMGHWQEFRSALAARMPQFSGALYPEMVAYEMARYFESEVHGRGHKTENVEQFLGNVNLMMHWWEFRSALAARMPQFSGVLYPEMVAYEVARYFESEAQVRHVKEKN